MANKLHFHPLKEDLLRILILKDDKENGFIFEGLPKFSFSIHQNSIADYDRGIEKAQKNFKDI